MSHRWAGAQDDASPSTWRNHYMRKLPLAAAIALTAASLTTLVTTAAEAAPTTVTLSNPAPIAPPDDVESGVISSLTVQGQPGRITDLNVTLKTMVSTFPGDLDIALTGPNGKTVMLLSDLCNSQDWTGQDLVIDDQAPRPNLSGDCTTFGPFFPYDVNTDDPVFQANAWSLAAAFNGISPNGVWTLRVADDETGDTSTFNGGFALTFALSDEAAPVVTVPAPKSSSKTKVSIPFSANESATFECALDDQGFKPCSSPFKAKKLEVGKHKLAVRATDTERNLSAPVTTSWKVKPAKKK
jgi:subtilisin-like proprotein convertase family protein